MDDLRALRREVTRVEQVARQLADTVTNQADNIGALASALAAVNAKTQRSSVALSQLAVGTTDVTVAWPSQWPDAFYGVYPALISGAGPLGTLFATLKSGTKAVDGCVVTVINTGVAVVAAAALDVLGVRT